MARKNPSPQVIQDVSGFPDRVNKPRVNQQRMLPTAVPTRVLGQIISGAPESTTPGTGVSSGVLTIGNGNTATIQYTTSSVLNRTLLAVRDVGVYLGSISDATQWPNATINMRTFPISIYNDWGQTDNVNVVTRVHLYNNTGSSQNIIVVSRARIIINPVGGSNERNE